MEGKNQAAGVWLECTGALAQDAAQDRHETGVPVGGRWRRRAVGEIIAPIGLGRQQARQPDAKERRQIAVLDAVVVGRIGDNQVYGMIPYRQAA